jgi:hypothetical protein
MATDKQDFENMSTLYVMLLNEFLKNVSKINWLWCYISVISALGRLR